MDRDFFKLANRSWNASRHVCVGIDIDLAKIPQHVVGDDATRVRHFIRKIIDATSDVAGAYKPNSAFFEALGGSGPLLLQETISYIHHVAPYVPVIVDAKRADIASTNTRTVNYLFKFLDADATTVHPYLGHEALRPFLNADTKGIFVLCRTSNPGAGELQDLNVGGEPLFLHVASLVARDWNHNGNCGLVVGATYHDELATIRNRVGNLPLLIPGIGEQGADLEATVRSIYKGSGLAAFINASRSVLYASDTENFAEAARVEVEKINSGIVNVITALLHQRS